MTAEPYTRREWNDITAHSITYFDDPERLKATVEAAWAERDEWQKAYEMSESVIAAKDKENARLREACEAVEAMLITAGLDSSSTNQWMRLRVRMWETLDGALARGDAAVEAKE